MTFLQWNMTACLAVKTSILMRYPMYLRYPSVSTFLLLSLLLVLGKTLDLNAFAIIIYKIIIWHVMPGSQPTQSSHCVFSVSRSRCDTILGEGCQWTSQHVSHNRRWLGYMAGCSGSFWYIKVIKFFYTLCNCKIFLSSLRNMLQSCCFSVYVLLFYHEFTILHNFSSLNSVSGT